jgi:hypothetical protein
MLAHYQYGHMPPWPSELKLDVNIADDAVYDKAQRIDFTITIQRGSRSAKIRAALIKPKGRSTRPIIIKNDHRLFDRPKSRRYKKAYDDEQVAIAEALKRGYVFCKFLRTDIAADEPGKRDQGVMGLYPDYDWGAIAAWAWGYRPVLFAVGALECADHTRAIATGHSRGGKAALCAGIYTEEIAIVAPNSSGTGGTGSMRYFEKGQRPQTIAAHIGKFDHWWCKRFLKFANKEKKLPFDAHFAKALIAPRGLVNPHATEDYWANPYGTQLTHQAAKIVYDWLGVPEKIGIHWRPGGHAQGIEDWRALLDFADAQFFKKKPKRKFDILPYKDAKPPINWKAPPSGDTP